jgi:phenylalanyl-tRNA synthetase beta chain
MNILIPDSWLRQFLTTKATPKQIKEYLSLSGPSVERVNVTGKETVYDVEITTNRPDCMSVAGIAREAAAILPRFGIAAKLRGNPYEKKATLPSISHPRCKLSVKTDTKLNPRWASVVFDNIHIGPSPKWLTQFLELAGIRSLNNVVDITNYLMHAYGQPAHVFDYDLIAGGSMTLRAARHGEKVTTLDGKTHVLPGGDIIIVDGTGKLIDLCGIMGGKNSAVSGRTTRVMLFLQTYEPVQIRKTSMALAQRTEAAGLFEKGIDTELVWPVFCKGIELMQKLTGGKVASRITDIYPDPYKSIEVKVQRSKINRYLGTTLTGVVLKQVLSDLGFTPQVTNSTVSVNVPSFRKDVSIDVDIIEEVARIYGYHNISIKLPDKEPPVVTPEKYLLWEEEIKIRLRDWGYTELYTYSMISEKQMDQFGLDKKKAYKITNPLSEEWTYLRPALWPGILTAVEQNLHHRDGLKLFELSMDYYWRQNDLPYEKPNLVVTWTGRRFREAKGLAEALFSLFGIPYPNHFDKPKNLNWYNDVRVQLGPYGSMGEVNERLLTALNIHEPVTMLDLEIDELVRHADPVRVYRPIPKYPPVIEDLSFTIIPGTSVIKMTETLKRQHPLIQSVILLDTYKNNRTFRISYLDSDKTLTADDVRPIREKLIVLAESKFGATLKTI